MTLVWASDLFPTDTTAISESGSGFDPTAWIALTLSIIGILVTALLRYLDGPRVRIRARPILFSVGHGPTITYNGAHWPVPESANGAELKRTDPGEVIELAEIVIENSGRHPMTAYDIGFRWLGRKKHWGSRRVRHSNVPTPLRPPGSGGPFFAEGSVFRIEPSDVVTVLVDYWGLVRSQRPNPRGRIELRAAVRVAGRRRLKLSPRKQQWRIPDEAVSAVGTTKALPLRAIISRSVGLLLLQSKEDELGDIYFLARSLESALEGKWSDDWKVNHERLKKFESDSDIHFAHLSNSLSRFTLMFSVHRTIDSYKDVIDWADIAQPGVHKMFSKEARPEED